MGLWLWLSVGLFPMLRLILWLLSGLLSLTGACLLWLCLLCLGWGLLCFGWGLLWLCLLCLGWALLCLGWALLCLGWALLWLCLLCLGWALLCLGWGFALPWVGCWVLGVFGVGCLGCWVFGVLGAWGGVGCRSGCPLWLGEASEGRAREGAPRGEGERRPEAFRALPSEGRAREGARRGEGERRPEGVRASP